MMMLLALPQPGPRLASPPRADAAWSSSIVPRPIPSRPEPPTRRMSRRVTPSCRIAQVFAGLPGYDDHRLAPWYPTSSVQSVRYHPRDCSRISNNYCIESEGPCPVENRDSWPDGTGTYVQGTFEGFPAPVALGLDRRGSLSNRRAKNRFNPRQQSIVAK